MSATMSGVVALSQGLEGRIANWCFEKVAGPLNPPHRLALWVSYHSRLDFLLGLHPIGRSMMHTFEDCERSDVSSGNRGASIRGTDALT